MAMQLILYGIIVVILGILGYYLGKNYTAIGPMVGAGAGVAVGALVSLGIWKASEPAPTPINPPQGPADSIFRNQ